MLDHAELNSEAFVLRRLTCSGTGSEESICQALAMVHAQGIGQVGDMFRIQQDSTNLRKAHPTALGTYPYVPKPVENAAHPTMEILMDFRLYS